MKKKENDIIQIIYLKTISKNMSDISRMKNSIPNLLNNIMYIIPEEVQLTSLKHISTYTGTENDENDVLSDLGIEDETKQKVAIVARSTNYDQLGYFIAKIKVEGILKDVVSSSSQKFGDYIDVTIEGVLP